MNVKHVEGIKLATIFVYGQHIGHTPRPRRDLYHLAMHPEFIACCMEDLFDVGCARHVAKLQQKQVSRLEDSFDFALYQNLFSLWRIRFMGWRNNKIR